MPVFHYKAARDDGELVQGTLQARDRNAAARTLEARGTLPILIDAALPGLPANDGLVDRKPAQATRRSKARPATIDLFTLELTTLLRANLPLAQALETLSKIASDPALAGLAAEVNRAVRNGSALSDALAGTGAGFDDFYCNMVRAGESSGALDLALERLSAFRASRRELRQSLVSALIYPTILLLLALVAVGVLLAFVVPQFTQLFADAGREMPLLTRIVAGSGEFMTRWWWLVLLGLAGSAYWLQQDWRSPAGRARWDRRLLTLPLVGNLVRQLDTARFARTLSTLLDNGINLVPALQIAREIVTNTVIAGGVRQVTQRVREGEALGVALARSAELPELASELIRVGESTGRLEGMLAQVAEIYEREVQTTLKRLLTLAEPVIIVGVALLITVIILSVVLMILESNDLSF